MKTISQLRKSSLAGTQGYQLVIFLQGDEGAKVCDLITNKGAKVGFNYLMQWEHGDDDGDITKDPFGSSDNLYKYAGYVMSYNDGLSYAGLYRKV